MKIGNKKDRHMFKNGRARPELKNRRSVCSCMSQGSSNESLKQKMMTAQKMNTLSCERRPIRQHIRNIIYRSFIRCFSQYSFEMVELG